MNRWIWSVDEGNWEVVKSEKLWAVSKESRTRKIKEDDFIVFYVKGTGMFRGAFQVVSGWYSAPEPIWNDETEGEIKYPYQCKLKEHVIGDAVFNELIQDLSCTKSKSAPQFVLQGRVEGPANYGKPIVEKDFNTITSRMKWPGSTPKDKQKRGGEHDKVIAKLKEIGTFLGFESHTDRDFTKVGQGAVVDLVWEIKMGNIGTIQYVFGVHIKGSIESLTSNFIHAISNPSVKKTIAVSGKQQLTEIRERITQMKAISESSKDMFVYLDINDVNRIHNLLQELQELESFTALIKLS